MPSAFSRRYRQRRDEAIGDTDAVASAIASFGLIRLRSDVGGAMLEFAAVTAAVASLTSVVDLADKVFGSWSKFRESKTVEAPAETAPDYFEKIAPSPEGGLAHSAGGAVKVITREELSKMLGPQEKIVIEALETKMDILVRQWSAITAEYSLVIDVSQRAIYDARLEKICVDLSKGLLQVTGLLQDLGFQLQDHYRAMRAIARER